MEKLKKEWPHMAVLGASFLLLPALAVLTGEGAVMVVLLLLVFPLESLLCSFFAGKAGGFAWWFFLATGVLFTATVPLYYNGTALLRQDAVLVFALQNALHAFVQSLLGDGTVLHSFQHGGIGTVSYTHLQRQLPARGGPPPGHAHPQNRGQATARRHRILCGWRG